MSGPSEEPTEMNMRFAAIPALVSLAVLVPGCLIGSDSRTVRTGEYVSPEDLGKIVPGTPAEEVVELLGEPTRMTTREDGTEIWKWVYREEVTSTGSVFLLFSKTTETVNTKEVRIEFRNGVVGRTL